MRLRIDEIREVFGEAGEVSLVAWDAKHGQSERPIFRRRMRPTGESDTELVAQLWACCEGCEAGTNDADIQIVRRVHVSRCRCMFWDGSSWLLVRSQPERRLWIETELERLETELERLKKDERLEAIEQDDLRDAVIKEALLLDPRVTHVMVCQMRRRDLGVNIVTTSGSDLEDVEENARRVFARVLRGSGPAPIFYLGNLQVL